MTIFRRRDHVAYGIHFTLGELLRQRSGAGGSVIEFAPLAVIPFVLAGAEQTDRAE